MVALREREREEGDGVDLRNYKNNKKLKLYSTIQYIILNTHNKNSTYIKKRMQNLLLLIPSLSCSSGELVYIDRKESHERLEKKMKKKIKQL